MPELKFDCVNRTCPRKCFCARQEWRRTETKSEWSANFSKENSQSYCPWFIPCRSFDQTGYNSKKALKLFRAIKDLQRREE